MNPFFRTKATDDPVVKELARLGIATPQTPSTIKLRGKQTPLSDDERQTLAEQEGKQLYSRLKNLVTSNAWSQLTDDRKRQRVAELQRGIEASRQRRLLELREQGRAEYAARNL
jgi:hypothetical protein